MFCTISRCVAPPLRNRAPADPIRTIHPTIHENQNQDQNRAKVIKRQDLLLLQEMKWKLPVRVERVQVERVQVLLLRNQMRCLRIYLLKKETEIPKSGCFLRNGFSFIYFIQHYLCNDLDCSQTGRYRMLSMFRKISDVLRYKKCDSNIAMRGCSAPAQKNMHSFLFFDQPCNFILFRRYNFG